MPPSLLVEPDSLLRWAWHAMPPRHTRDGQATGAFHGLAGVLLRVLDDHRPRRVVAAWDSAPPTWRHAAYPGYQAERAPEDPGLTAQRALAEELLAALDPPVLKVSGWAARDVLATVAAELDGEVLILSADRDLCQVVENRITLLAARVGGLEVFDPAAVEARYGVTPGQWAEAKALEGDPGNGVAGVSGVGEKIAARLVAAYRDVEGVLAAAPRIGGKRGELLAAGAEQVRAARAVIMVRRDAPVDTPPGGWPAPSARPEAVARLLTRLECGDLVRRLTPRALAPSGGPSHRVVNDAADVQRVVEAARAARVVGVAAAPGGVALSPGRGEAWWVPRAWAEVALAPLRSGEVGVVAHDVARLGALAARPAGDTRVAFWLLHPDRESPPPAELARRWLGVESGHGDGAEEDALRDADLVRRVEPVMREALERDGLGGAYLRRELPVAAALAAQELDLRRTAHGSGRFEGPDRAVDGAVVGEVIFPDAALRLLAELSGDRALRGLLAGAERADLAVAGRLAGCGADDVSELQRRRAAALNLTALRGGDAAWLARRLQISAGEARAQWTSFAAAFPAVEAFARDVTRRARREGAVRTLGGRRLPAGPDDEAPKLVRAALEAALGDMLAAALVALHAARVPVLGPRPAGWCCVWEAPREAVSAAESGAAQLLGARLPAVGRKVA